MAHLLVVDDEPTLLRLEKEILQTAGHRVQTAESVDETVNLLRESKPDVVVMDLRLPDTKDGLALIRTIDEMSKSSKIVVLSGWPAELNDAPERKLVHRLFAKPLRMNVLLQAIAELA